MLVDHEMSTLYPQASVLYPFTSTFHPAGVHKPPGSLTKQYEGRREPVDNCFFLPNPICPRSNRHQRQGLW